MYTKKDIYTFMPQNARALFSRSGTKLPPFGGSLRTDVIAGVIDGTAAAK